MPNEKEHLTEVRVAARELASAAAKVRSWAAHDLAEAEASHAQAISDAKTAYAAAEAAAQDAFQDVVMESLTALERPEQELGLLVRAWSDPGWSSWPPGEGFGLHELTRLGDLVEPDSGDELRTPALAPIIGTGNLLIKAGGGAKSAALSLLQSTMLRLLVALPAGKLRFVLVDPVGLGSNVAGFMHLPEELIGGKAWTEAPHIEQRLADLSAHMEMVIQKYLRNDYVSMEAYNARAGEVAEPYRLLVIANFPTNFSESAARRLLSIASNGPRTGVYVLASIDTDQKLPYQFNLADLERTATVIETDGNTFTYRDPVFQGCRLVPDEPPPQDMFGKFIEAIAESVRLGSKVEVPFARVVPEPSSWWLADSRHGIRAPIGRIGATDFCLFELGRGTAQHALIAGKTGSGKSNLLHVIITSLCITYSPDELLVYLVDFKKGVEFRDYAAFGLPHASVIAIQSEREFGLSVLRALDEEMQRRGDLLRAAGFQNLWDYRDALKMRLPRILLVIDEFQELFTEDDALASAAAQLLDRLVRQGRAFGIHVLLGSQSLAGTHSIARSTTDQMAVRIALQCSEADSRLILSDDNPGARLLGRPGEGIYNASNGVVEGNMLFQALWLPDDERESYLQKIRHAYESIEDARPAGEKTLRRQVVFEGTAPARLEDNDEFAQMLGRTTWEVDPAHARLMVGEPVDLRPRAVARLARQSRANVLVIGHDEEAAISMLVSSVLGFAVQRAPREVSFLIFDLTTDEAPTGQLIRELKSGLPHKVDLIGRRNLLDALGKTVVTVGERGAAEDEQENPSVLLYFLGVHRARELRSDDPYTPSDAATQLVKICREGPELGVHVLMWCDTYANLERVMGRRDIAEFDQRVALQMSASESMNLLDAPAASKLGRWSALLQDEDRVGHLEKFRPYGLLTSQWVRQVGGGSESAIPPLAALHSARRDHPACRHGRRGQMAEHPAPRLC